MTTPIRTALVAGSSLQDQVKDGVQALKQVDLNHVEQEIRAWFADSLALDEALKQGHPQDCRWDYLLGHEGSQKVIGLEPHTANNHEISRVIKKRQDAIDQLRGHLRPGVHVADWFWVASGKVDFLPLEKATNRLASQGIKFVGKTLLKKYLPVADTINAKKKSNKVKKKSKR